MAYLNPDYVQPTRYVDPNNPQGSTMGQTSDFWKDKQYVNPYAKFTQKAGQRSDEMFNAAKGMNMGGLLNGGPNAFRTKFGFGNIDINNPGTQRTLQNWMGNLNGGVTNRLDAASKQLASSGVASTRGGMGVAGGVDPAAMARAQAMKEAAGMYGENFDRSVGYMKDNANLESSAASAMANLYGNVYNTNIGAGQGLLGQELQGTKAGADDRNAWLDKIFSAYSTDTNTANQMKQGAQKTFQDKMDWEKKQRTDQFTDDQRAMLEHLLQYGIMEGPGRTMTYPQSNIQEFLKQKDLIKGKTSGKGSGALDLNSLLGSRQQGKYSAAGYPI